jgi:hypothetical protein
LLEVFRDRSAVDYATLTAEIDVSPRTLDRQLGVLLAEGRLFRRSHGVYSRRPPEPGLNPEGVELLALLRGSDADAHLTGFDVLAPYAHQFAHGYEHLVYCHPPHASGLTSELSDAHWLVLPAGRHARLSGTPERTVVLRGQAHDARRYPVRDHVALPEKAWVDLLREVRRSQLAFDYGELGRILRSLERAGTPLARLRTYARSVGYHAWVQAALGEREPASGEQAQLAAGYAA